MAPECERFRDDLALLAVDDPDFSPTPALLDHAERCPSCRAFLRRSRENLARLVLGEAEPPPDRVKNQLMATIRAEGRNSVLPGANEESPAGLPAADAVRHREPSTHGKPPRASRWAGWAGWQVAAVLILMISLAANGRMLMERRETVGQGALVAQLEALQAILFAPDYAAPRVFALETGTPGLSGHVAFCRVSDDSFYVMVASEGWSRDAPGQEYRLWLQSGDQIIDGGGLTFSGDRGLGLFKVSEPLPVQAVRLGTGQGSPLLWTQVDDPWPPSGAAW